MKTALFITGASARISQEVAVLDLLMSEKGLTLSQDDTLIAGYSSGSINVLAINACFRKNNPLSWNEWYKEEKLFKMKERNVFEFFPFTGRSILNTAPFRDYLSDIMEETTFRKFGDLPFKSHVITSQYHDQSTYWADNGNKGNGQLNPVDLFMASTAIPIVLPSIEIENTDSSVQNRDFPEGNFIDGGSWGSFVNYEGQLQNFISEYGVFGEMHIVSPMRENKVALKALKKHEFKKWKDMEHEVEEDDLAKFDLCFNIGLEAFISFVRGLNELNKKSEIAKAIYVSIPSMPKNTGFLSFGKQKSAYKITRKWLETDGKHQLKVPIEDFVKLHANLNV